MTDDDGFEQWLNEHRAEFQAKIDAADFWMKAELPHYLATCGGKPTGEGFNAYLDERMTADPELKKLIEKGLICRVILEKGAELDASGPMTIMNDAELLRRLGLKPE